jgi:hypothetical protein
MPFSKKPLGFPKLVAIKEYRTKNTEGRMIYKYPLSYPLPAGERKLNPDDDGVAVLIPSVFCLLYSVFLLRIQE